MAEIVEEHCFKTFFSSKIGHRKRGRTAFRSFFHDYGMKIEDKGRGSGVVVRAVILNSFLLRHTFNDFKIWRHT